MITIPDTHIDLFEKPVVVAMATLMPDGQPQVNCVWADFDGEYLWMFTVKDFQKARNLYLNPRVTLLAVDPDNPYRYVEVRGKAVELSEENVERIADRLAKKYTGKDHYYGGVEPEENRGGQALLSVKIEPKRVVTRHATLQRMFQCR